MKFPSEGSELDFGLVRVLEDNMKTMAISNTGKYEVGYRFRIKTSAMRALFTITPQEGTIEPGKEQQVKLLSLEVAVKTSALGFVQLQPDKSGSEGSRLAQV